MSTPVRHVRLLPGTAQAPRIARAFVLDTAGRHPSYDVDDAVLLASELVTAALNHAAGPVVLSLEALRADLVVRASTTADPRGWPRCGCGLAAWICHDWGVESARQSTIFWGRLLGVPVQGAGRLNESGRHPCPARGQTLCE